MTGPAVPVFGTPAPAATAMTLGPKILGTADANSIVRLYSASDCGSGLLASDTTATFASPGIAITIPAASVGSAFNIYATATDQVGNVSACTPSPVSFTSTLPVVNSTTSPASPSQSTTPTISGTGTQTADTTVALFLDSGCTTTASTNPGTVTSGAWSVTANPVGSNSATTFYAEATVNGFPASACSTTWASYQNDTSEQTPVITSASISGSTVVLKGTSSESSGAASTIYLYANDATCNNGTAPGTSVGSGPLGDFTGATGVPVPLIASAATNYYALSEDSAGNVSACSAAFPFAPFCANSVVNKQIFVPFMQGCAGSVTYANRASLCSSNAHVCTADEWVEQRGGGVPAHHYWTDDALRYSTGTGPCGTSICGSGNCFAGRGTMYTTSCANPMRVCTTSPTDPEGNVCEWTGCGFNSAGSGSYFGGCSQNAAGTLCCSNGLHSWYVDPSGSDSNSGSSASPFSTITHAMSMAAAGDTVFVNPGTYTESFTVTAGVNLIGNEASAGTSPLTKIAGTVTLGSNATVAGFTITNTGSYGLTASGPGAIIRNNTIVGNASFGAYIQTANTTVFLNSISGNTTGGVYFYGSNSGKFENNSLTGGSNYNIYLLAAGSDLGGGPAGSIGNNIISCAASVDLYANGLAVSAANNKWDHVSPTSSASSPSGGVDMYPGGTGSVTTTGSSLAPNSCPKCASGATQTFDTNFMVGCSGTSTHAGASAICPTYCHLCTAAEYNSHYNAVSPTHNYWTSDFLRYGGSGSNSCSAGVNLSSTCGYGSSMLVCAPTASGEQQCTWVNCGYSTSATVVTSPNEYFGGCLPTSDSAGAMCCCP